MHAKDAIELGKKNGAVMVDLKFCDLLGQWQHTSVPIHRLTEDSFEEGFGFDGSSIRGWKAINESDMLLLPEPSSAVMDPFMAQPTMSLICNIADPITHQPYARDPRYVARKAEAYLKSTGLADTVFFGPEAEFFVFDEVRYEVKPEGQFFFIDSEEATWNSGGGSGKNQGYTIRHKQGYFPVAPHDRLMDLRTEMCQAMEAVGIEVETSHHEVATAGQCEIDMKFDTLTVMADKLLWFKYVVKNVAFRAGKTATFMPKPMYGDNGSGMHCHQSLWKDGKPLFYSADGYAGLSEMAMHYIGGILKHAKALNAITNPSTNSYRRLVPGYEAPVNLAYSSRNRSASIRIPMFSASPKAKRLEVRFPDPSCNGYLAFAAMLMAGLDGVKNKLHPGDALDKDIYNLSPEEARNVPQVCGSLGEALDALEKDHAFLLEGDVFTPELIETWIDYKRTQELDPVRLRPVPMEYFLYYDV